MQEVALSLVRPMLPPTALNAMDEEVFNVEAPDERLLAEFEDLMPTRDAEAETEHAVESTDRAMPVITARTVGTGGASLSQGGGSWEQMQGAGADAGLLSTEFSIHHARIGVVHVRQSADIHGGVIHLSTEDATLRQRLEGSAKGLKSVMADAQGRSPEVEIGS
jgi:hypothetical protein